MQTLSTRTETPEFLSSLSTLSEFYGDNTAAERRNLRSTIEQQGLAVDSQFLAAASTVIASLDAIEADVEKLSACCRGVGSSLASSKVAPAACNLMSLTLPACHGQCECCQTLLATILQVMPAVATCSCSRHGTCALHAGAHCRHAEREQATACGAADQRGTLWPGAAVPAAIPAVS